MTFTVAMQGFADGADMPSRFTCDGKNVSPAINWQGEPGEARSFALIMDDPDAPAGTWDHWLLWDIPADVHSLPEGGKADTFRGKSGTNSFGKTGYGGPCPPKGKGSHRYFLHMFALNTETLGLEEGAKRPALDKALREHSIAEATYMGRYGRP